MQQMFQLMGQSQTLSGDLLLDPTGADTTPHFMRVP